MAEEYATKEDSRLVLDRADRAAESMVGRLDQVKARADQADMRLSKPNDGRGFA